MRNPASATFNVAVTLGRNLKTHFSRAAIESWENYQLAESYIASAMEKLSLPAAATRSALRTLLLGGTALTAIGLAQLGLGEPNVFMREMTYQLTGLFGSLVLMSAGYHRNVTERNAAQTIGGFGYVGHLMMNTQGYERLVQVLMFSIRSATMTAVGDNAKLRRSLMIGFLGVGGVLMARKGFPDAFSFLPLTAMVCGVVASGLTNKHSHIARLLSTLPTPALIAYDTFVTQSLGGVLMEGIATGVEIQAIRDFDIPRFDKTGNKYGAGMRMTLYFKSLVTGTQTSDWTIDRLRQHKITGDDLKNLLIDPQAARSAITALPAPAPTV
jgi:hypothetical protein